jgi:hypothetical protein
MHYLLRSRLCLLEILQKLTLRLFIALNLSTELLPTQLVLHLVAYLID